MEALSARGQTTNDLVITSFKVHEVIPDKTFVKCTVGKEEKCEEGEAMHHNKLMMLADVVSKFKTLKQKKQWQAPLPEDKKIVVVESKFKSVMKDLKRNEDDGKEETGKESNEQKNCERNMTTKQRPNWMSHGPTKDELNCQENGTMQHGGTVILTQETSVKCGAPICQASARVRHANSSQRRAMRERAMQTKIKQEREIQ